MNLSLQMNLRRPLTPTQWLPKPATSQVPKNSCALRATWSPGGGEGEELACERFRGSMRDFGLRGILTPALSPWERVRRRPSILNTTMPGSRELSG